MSVKVSIKATDMSKFKKDMKKFIVENDKIINVALDATALKIQEDAKRLVPVDKGVLRANIFFNTPDKRKRRIFTDTRYGAYVELGTGPHEIRVKKAKVLSNGKQFFGTKVMHPGTKAQPFLRPALNKNRNTFTKAYNNAFKRL